ncbi:MAG: hypothetical protein IKE24_09920 [Clostridia bacterium]|nr:hypothetical protein [Clostridia bacterium]
MRSWIIVLKKGAKGLAFAVVFLILWILVDQVMMFKQEDGTLPARNFYDLPADTVDVLVLGTSHAGMNVSSQTLWDEYGIASYRFWGSIQPIWNSYYYLLEALKYQQPKVVVLDAHSLTFNQEYGTYPVQIKNTIGLRPSRNKLENILASVPEEDRAAVLLGLPVYHNRYTELREEDFDYMAWQRHPELQVLSSEESVHIYPFTIREPDPALEEAPLGEKEEKYFRMLLEFCREKGIALELVVSPYEISVTEQQKYLRVASIAAEYGVRYTDFNLSYREYGIDPQQDFLDPGHFNRYGLPKYARALAELLRERYTLPDRRQDPDHIWNRLESRTVLPVYALTEQFDGDGRQDFLDTGYPLMENPLSSWTLCTRFTLPEAAAEQKVIMACYEDQENAGGFRVCRETGGNLGISFGKQVDTQVQNPAEEITLCVVKKGKQFTIYVNGVLTEDRKMDTEELLSLSGGLLLGCQKDPAGRRIRFARTRVKDLQIYDCVLSEKEVLEWTPKELPVAQRTEYLKDIREAESILALESRFEGNGELYVDSGVALYEDPERSFTLLSRIDPEITAGDSVYFSCFCEVPGEYRGLLVRRTGEDQLNVVFGNGHGVNLPLPTDRPSVLAVVKDRSAYTLWLNGEKMVDEEVAVCDSYDGSFLIGAQTDASGEIFRQSGIVLYNLEIYEGILKEDQILAWTPLPLNPPPRDPGMDVTYQLPEALTGNGRDIYVDTGIRLLDNPKKDWTIHLRMDQVNVREGAVLSCFDETPGKYRGLLLRQSGRTTFSLVLGGAYAEVEIHPADQLEMYIVKQDDRWQVYAEGELKAEARSSFSPYLGNLFLCAERDQRGIPFRFSTISLREVQVINRALETEEIIGPEADGKEETT